MRVFWGHGHGHDGATGWRTTQQVADYLNVSRPYVVNLIDSGKLPARKVGSRRRVALVDLLRFDQEDSKTRGAALDEFTRLGQELGL